MNHPPHLPTLSSKASRLLLITWLLLGAAGYLAVLWLQAGEQNRDLRQWAMQMQLVASSQARSIVNWLTKREDALNGLADNTSLRLYVTDAPPGSEVADAQVQYLRNLIEANAGWAGFTRGIALVNPDGNAIATTPGFVTQEALAQLAPEDKPREPMMSEPFKSDGDLVVAWRRPVYGVQADEQLSQPVALLYGMSALDKHFFTLFDEKLQAIPSLKAWVLFKDRGQLKRIDATPGEVERRLDNVKSKTAPETLLYSGKTNLLETEGGKLLAVSAPVDNTSWQVGRALDLKIALLETKHRAFLISCSYLLGVLAIALLIVSLWRHSSSLRNKALSAYYRETAETIEQQEKLLELIAETTPAALAILDQYYHYCYANRMAAELAGSTREYMQGRPLEKIWPEERANAIREAAREALARQEDVSRITRETAGDTLKRVSHSQYLPLASLPIPGKQHPGVLVIDEDITKVVREEEKNAEMLNRLVETLVGIVDKRDPNAAEHSRKVSRLARTIAQEMGLDTIQVKTAEIAGRLMNIGKIAVPAEMLTAKRSLKADESKLIQQSILASADLLEGIAFDGPVVQTIRQSQEAMDGTGPLKLEGEDILLTARITHVANSFVAFTSPRAYRKSEKPENALKTMLEKADQIYDRSVLAALIHHIENE